MKAVAAILQALVALAVIGVAAFLFWRSQGTQHALAKAERQAGTATVQAGQADVHSDVAAILAAAQQRDRVTIIKEQADRAEIMQAPHATDALDPDLVRRARVQLCGFAAYLDDPGCAQLRQGDPGGSTPAGEAGPAVAP